MKYLILILISFLAAMVQVSFLPHLRIFGGTINLPIIILGYNLYLTESSRKSMQVLLLAILLGLFIDLLSAGTFLSASLSLLLLALFLESLQKLISVDGFNPLSLLLVFVGTIIFDVLYQLFNRILEFSSVAILPTLFDAVLTSLVFLLVMTLARSFQQKRHAEIKLS